MLSDEEDGGETRRDVVSLYVGPFAVCRLNDLVRRGERVLLNGEKVRRLSGASKD
jgi:hypothetical protein